MIIENIETMKQHIATIVGDDFDRYKPYVAKAEAYCIREITGKELFIIIPNNTKLLGQCQAVVAHKAYLDAIPFLDLVETESGFAVTHNTNLTPASTARVASLLQATSVRLDECIEDLLEALEAASEEIKTAWKGSKTYTLINDNYVSSIRQFREYGVFAGNRLAWAAQRHKLRQIRKLKIEPVISAALSEQIIEQLRDEELENEETPVPVDKIIDDLRFALAAYFNEDTATGDSFLARVRDFLIANVDDFPAFKTSDIYVKYLATEARDTTEDPFMLCGV